MARVIIVDTLTGRRLLDVPWVSYRWSRPRNAPETLSAVLNLNDPDVREMNLRTAATPGKTSLAVVEEVAGGEWFAGAGELNKPAYDRDAGRLTVSASGIGLYFKERFVLPPSAASVNVADFLVPDPGEPSKTMPNPALATSLSGWSFGTLVKKLIEQALSSPSGGLPIVLPADIVGTRTKTWEGIDFKPVWDAVMDISRLDGGPDVALPARYQSDRRGIEWVLRTGTDDEPELRSSMTFRWNISAEQSSTRALKVDFDASKMGSISWATGGRSDDTALVERATDTSLLSAGYPLREILDSTHTDVSVRATLSSYAQSNLDLAQDATEVWSFQVKKDEPPFLGQYDVGDICELTVEDDPYIPDGVYLREIAGMSGNQSDWVTLQTMEVI